MDERNSILRDVMQQTGTTQSALSRFSGVHQPSISQVLSGTKEMSDDLLVRLLSCMGRTLEVTRRPLEPKLTRSERRSWSLHRKLSSLLTAETLAHWTPVIERNLERLADSTSGEPHQRNLDRWRVLVEDRNVREIKRFMTGLDRGAIEMREVSPLGGLLPESDRQEVLRELAR